MVSRGLIIKIIGLLILLNLILFMPYNDTKYIVDKSGEIKISRIDRKSLLADYGTFLTPGKYTNVLFKPKTYINPWYIGIEPFDLGCFNLYAEFKSDTTIIHPGSYCKAKNLNPKFQLTEISNAFGELNWSTISSDTTGRYLLIDCSTGL